MDYTPKQLYFDHEGRQRLVAGIKKLSSAVKSTLGPSGNTVLIESPNHTHGITVTKDGVTVAKAVDLLDPVENLAVKIMKEAADRTATDAGDGTTTAIVLTEAMVMRGIEKITPQVNRTEVLRKMVEVSDNVVEMLRKKSRRVGKSTIADVATISANNDKTVGKIIAEVYKDVGRNGIVTVERSKTTTTYAETTLGMKISRGYYSHLFVNDQKKEECVLEDVMILVADVEIHNILQIEQVLRPIVAEGKRLLIIAPCTTNVVNTLAANVMKNSLKLCAIQPPSFGFKQHELMHDIAVSVGATYFSEKTGDDLSHITYADLGHAAKVIVGRDNTVLVSSDVRRKETMVTERVEQLREAHKLATKKADRDFLMERIAMLSGGIGVIYVGGNTDLEQKELYDRIDDAVCAVRSAMEEGILPGAGKALYEVALEIPPLAIGEEHAIALDIVVGAIQEPLKQIISNAGMVYSDIYGLSCHQGHGYDVKTGKFGDLIHMGVIDPLKVTRCALQNAVSVASTILSTNAIITMARSYDTK